MKRIIRFCFIIASILFSFSCTNYQDEDVPDGLSVSSNEIVFPSNSESQPITVRSGFRWDVSSIPEWLSIQSIDQSSSSFEWIVNISSEDNREFNREGAVVVKTTTEYAFINVTQEGERGKYIAVESVSISQTDLTLTEDDQVQLKYDIYPSDASIKTVTWESSSSSVVTVSNTGLINAVSEGKARVTVKTDDGNKMAFCDVTVKAKKISVTGVSLDQTSLTMTEGDIEALIATIVPSNATDKSVTWSSSNTSIATVSSSGVITAKSPGNATITVKTNDGGKTASCTVTVNAKTVAVTGVSLNKTSLSMTVGDTETLIATVSPSNATNKTLIWTSNNTVVADVSSTGVVTAKAEGTATIYVVTNDGEKTATCSVTVKSALVPVTGVSLNKSSLSLLIGGTEKLIATVYPSNATNKNVTWSSSSSNVASVDSNGNVSAIKVGTAIITVTTEDGRRTASCTVTVNPIPVTSVSLNQTSMTMTVGDTQTLSAVVSPSNATDKSVSWSSSNTSVATVSSSGLVTAKAAGSAIISVVTNDGGKKATCNVTVQEKTVSVTGVSLDRTSLSMTVGDTWTLTATVSPSNATNKSVSWSSSNSSVASVSSSGTVTAKAAGSSTITVTTNDGGKTATCSISVQNLNNYSLVSVFSANGLDWTSYDYASLKSYQAIKSDHIIKLNYSGYSVYFPKGTKIDYEEVSSGSDYIVPSIGRIAYITTLPSNLFYNTKWEIIGKDEFLNGWSPVFERINWKGNGQVELEYLISSPEYLPTDFDSTSSIQLKGTLDNGTELCSDWIRILPVWNVIDNLAMTSNNKALNANATLAVENNPSIPICYNGGGVDLAKLISIQMDGFYHTLTEFNELFPGFSFHFDLIPYSIGEDKTSEDMYGSLNGNIFTPCYVVKVDDNTYSKTIIEKGSESGISAVGRMPIVMVSLVNENNGSICAIGYLKILISKTY